MPALQFALAPVDAAVVWSRQGGSPAGGEALILAIWAAGAILSASLDLRISLRERSQVFLNTKTTNDTKTTKGCPLRFGAMPFDRPQAGQASIRTPPRGRRSWLGLLVVLVSKKTWIPAFAGSGGGG